MKQPPFKVMCVKPTTYNFTRDEFIASPVEVGTTYTVVGIHEHERGLSYFLEGFAPYLAFKARCFAILPDQSADEMQEVEREGIVNLETSVV